MVVLVAITALTLFIALVDLTFAKTLLGSFGCDALFAGTRLRQLS